MFIANLTSSIKVIAFHYHTTSVAFIQYSMAFAYEYNMYEIVRTSKVILALARADKFLVKILKSTMLIKLFTSFKDTKNAVGEASTSHFLCFRINS